MKLKQLITLLLTAIMLFSSLAVVASADSALPDGVKEAAYTDEKKLVIGTAYGGDRGASIENTNNLYSETYYYWDDTYVYVWWDVYDADGVVTLDNMYYNPDPTWAGAVYQNGGGAVVANIPSNSLVWDNTATWKVAKGSGANGVRSYEMRFPRGTGTSGFVINPVIWVSGTYTVSYQSSYQMNGDGKVVLFDDNTTWFDDSAKEAGEKEPITDPNNWVDGIKEDAYTSDKMLEVSTAFTGQGGLPSANVNHVFSRTYYYWDDTYVYLWWDIYDPDGVVTIDAFYYLAEGGEDLGGTIFQQATGGQAAYYPASDTLSIEKPTQFSMIPGEDTGATRSLEMAFKHGGRECFLINPVSFISGTYTVSYGSAYLAISAAKKVVYADASTYTTDLAIDPNVVTDEGKLANVKAAIERLPADPATLQESDRPLVDEVKAVVETVPAAWLTRLSSDLQVRYSGSIARMLELEAIKNEKKIKDVESIIAALPETVSLENKAAVDQAKADFDALGDIKVYVDPQLTAKLNGALNRLDTLSHPVSIDGELDPAYQKGISFELLQEYNYLSSSNVLGTDPFTYGKVATYADDEYIYIHAEVFTKDPIYLAEDKDYSLSDEVLVDGIITYVNPDPLNDPTGTPADCSREGSKDFQFSMQADGTVSPIYKMEGKNEFIYEETNFASFVKDSGYGYEMRIPRVEGEEDYKLNFVIIDPVFTDGALDHEASRMIALGGAWGHSYVGYGDFWFEDFEQIMNYDEIAAIIEGLPAADAVTDDTCREDLDEAKAAIELLNKVQKEMITQEMLAKLAAVEEALDNLNIQPPKPAFTYGDLNDDGQEDAVDALMTLQIAVDKLEATETMKLAADVSGNGEINAEDALYILQKAVDKIQQYPAEKNA